MNYGNFIYMSILDRITGVDNSYIATMTYDTQPAKLKFTCDSDNTPNMSFIGITKPLLFSEQGFWAWRFDTNLTQYRKEVYQQAGFGPYVARVFPLTDVVKFTRNAAFAKEVGVRIRSFEGQQLDLFFKLR